MFLEFMYSGVLKWPEGTPDPMTAAELLILADYYDVEYLLTQAQIVLRFAVNLETCCEMLALAEHHSAEHLQQCCLHHIIRAHNAHGDVPNLDQLSPLLKDKLRANGWAG